MATILRPYLSPRLLATFALAAAPAATFGASNAQRLTSPTTPETAPLALTVHCEPEESGRVRVDFGLPLARGELHDAGVIRVESPSGEEIPSAAAPLVLWRSLAPASITRPSIRSVLVSFEHACREADSATYLVRWNAARRQVPPEAPRPERLWQDWVPQAPPDPAEHPATDNYALDDISKPTREPRAWVTLPAEWLLRASLPEPAVRITDPKVKAAMIGYARMAVNDSPAADVAGSGRARHGSELIDWRSEVEGWLYDRPGALWTVYRQTGELKWLRHAHRASQYYASWIALDDSDHPYRRGAFRKKPATGTGDPGDPKYSTSGGLLAAYLLTGDARLLERIEAIGDFVGQHVQTRLPPQRDRHALWTERQVAVALSGTLHAFEATGKAHFASRALEIIDVLDRDARQPPSGYPTDMQGVLLHSWRVHEGIDKPGWIVSPWMSALLADALWHYYSLSSDQRALRLIFSYADFVARRALVERPCGPGGKAGLAPRYLASIEASPDTTPANIEHAFDVLGLLQRGLRAASLLGLPAGVINESIDGLKTCALHAFDAGRSGLPGRASHYRLTPTRKFNWWFGSPAPIEGFEARNPHKTAVGLTMTFVIDGRGEILRP